MFYEVLMEKRAEANYYSRYLNEAERRRAFDAATQRRATRDLGRNDSRNTYTRNAAIGGGLGGLLVGGVHHGVRGAAIGGLTGALTGAGLGYVGGGMADKARDRRTLAARDIQKMPASHRAQLLEHKRARRLEYEDEMRRTEERLHRMQIQNDLAALRAQPAGVYR